MFSLAAEAKSLESVVTSREFGREVVAPTSLMMSFMGRREGTGAGMKDGVEAGATTLYGSGSVLRRLKVRVGSSWDHSSFCDLAAVKRGWAKPRRRKGLLKSIVGYES